jgi:N-acetyl-gamma-glutamyl-phosphate reductase
MAKLSNAVRIGILGASGYTGAELLRLLARHPQAEIRVLTANAKAGKPVGEVFPHLAHLDLPVLKKVEDADWSGLDVVFCALPHGTTQEIIAKLPKHLRVVDLSADFRLHDLPTYAKWYGHEHKAPELQKEAVYGLTELAREAVKKARLVANPGCYPTAAQLPLVPLVEAGAIEAGDIIIDAKSGVSGAGREAKEANMFAEVAEGIHPYSIASHRHAPEIEQGLAKAAGKPIVVNFTAHLMPMNRGIEETIYVKLVNGATADDLRTTLAKRYQGEPFVRVVPKGGTCAARTIRSSACSPTAFRGGRFSSRCRTIWSRALPARRSRT